MITAVLQKQKLIRQLITYFVMVFFIPVIKAGDTSTPIVLTLEKAITLALEQNRDVLMANQDRLAAKAQVREARAGALPQITISSQFLRNIKKPVIFIGPYTPFNRGNTTMTFEVGSDNSFLMGAQLSQALFNAKLGAALDIAKTYRDYSEESYQATTQTIELYVKKSFYTIWLAQKLLEANRQGLDVVKANLENVRSQYRHGTAAEYDLLRAEVQLANTEPLYISAENNLVLAKNGFKNILAIPLDQDIELQGEFTYDQIPIEIQEESRRNAFATNPLIMQLTLQESILEKNISVEKANFYPNLNLFGSYQWQAQDNTFDVNRYLWVPTMNVGLQLTYPLFDGFRTSSRVQQALVSREKIRYTRIKAEEGLRIQIQSTELKMAEAQKRITGQEKNIEQAKKAVRIAQTRYTNGLGTQLELLDTQVAMTRAQTNYAQAIYDYLVARAEWEFAVGQSK